MAGLPEAGTVNEVRNGDAIHQVGNRRGAGSFSRYARGNVTDSGDVN